MTLKFLSPFDGIISYYNATRLSSSKKLEIVKSCAFATVAKHTNPKSKTFY